MTTEYVARYTYPGIIVSEEGSPVALKAQSKDKAVVEALDVAPAGAITFTLAKRTTQSARLEDDKTIQHVSEEAIPGRFILGGTIYGYEDAVAKFGEDSTLCWNMRANGIRRVCEFKGIVFELHAGDMLL